MRYADNVGQAVCARQTIPGRHTDSHRSEKIADEHNWNEQYFDAVNQLAKSYYEMYNFNESLNMLLELYDFAEKNLPPEYSLKALNNMAVLYCEEEQYDKAVVSFQKIYNYAKVTMFAIGTPTFRKKEATRV